MTSQQIEKIKSTLSKQDPVLKKIIDKIDYPIIEPTDNLFHDLMSLVIEQQIHYRSTKKSFQKMLDLASIQELTLDNFHLLEEHSFENARFSVKKFETLNEVIELFTEKTIDWNSLSNDEIRNQLKKIKGIGSKTIDAILIYSLQRDNIFIHDDYHIQKIIPQLYGMESDGKLTANIRELSKKWSPYKSHAFRYLLAWKDASSSKKLNVDANE